MLKRFICYLLLFYFIVAVYAKDPNADHSVDKQGKCNTDDSECFDASTSSFAASYVTSSSSFYSIPYATYPAVLTDTLSDFHEAKVVHPRQGLQKPDKQPSLSPAEDNLGSIQDKHNENQDLDSHSHGLSDTLEETDSSVGLNRVEAGVVSACGILVVAGIAVGIFVWKNTVRRRSLQDQDDMTDLENHIDPDQHPDNGTNPIIVNGALSLKENINRQQKKTQQLNQQENNIAFLTTSGEAMMKPVQEKEQSEDQTIEMQELSKDPIIHDMELRSSDHILVMDANKQQPNTSTTVTLKQARTGLTSLSNISDRKEEVTNDTSVHTIQLSNPEQAPQFEGKPHLADIHDNQSSIYNAPNLLELDKKNTLAPELGNCFNEPTFSGSPGIEGNVATHTSALDPAFDPTALTYPLKKLMHTPRTITSSAHISVDLSRYEEDDDDEDEAEGEQLNIQTQKETVQGPSDHDKVESKLPTLKLGQQLNKLFRYPDQPTLDEQEQDSNAAAKVDISLVSSSDSSPNNHKEKKKMVKLKKGGMLEKLTKAPPLRLHRSSLSAQSIKEDYTEKYETEYGKPFLSPLDLPNDKYIPLRDAAGPPLMSRAQVLADPVKRLGEDEIALWEQNLKKKKEFSYEMWDEQMMKEEVEDKHIANCYEEPSSTT